MVGEHVTTQHKLVVFVIYMKKKWEVKNRGWKMTRWRKCRDNAIEYKERVRARYEELSEEAKGLGKWKEYREAFRGLAEVFCGRTSEKDMLPRDINQILWTEEIAKAVGEMKEVLKRIERIKDRG